jgi:para-aminobenzoate synthetase/4-amino-4-deoxychorismate lyase
MDTARAPSETRTFALLETMRLEDGRLRRIERHLARAAAAARDFGHAWDEAAVRAALAAAAAGHPGGPWRARLLVSRNGVPTVECTPHDPAGDGPWRVGLAAEPIDDRDPFILHKTTHRAVYERARRSRPDLDDVLLWNARGEVTESTVGNVVAEIDGVRWTPPLRCGLLAGTFRAEQLDAGALRERVLTKTDVGNAPRLWIINSVREWVDAMLVM